MGQSETEFATRPYTIIIDTREQSAFSFRDIRSDSREGGGPIILKTERKALKSGDYSIDGVQERCAIERKSLEDLFHCVGSDRERFLKQLERLNELECAALVVEADWPRVLKGCPHSQLKPKTVYRSVISWQQRNRYPNIHWWFCPGKRFAEITTFRILDRFWKASGEEQGREEA